MGVEDLFLTEQKSRNAFFIQIWPLYSIFYPIMQFHTTLMLFVSPFKEKYDLFICHHVTKAKLKFLPQRGVYEPYITF